MKKKEVEPEINREDLLRNLRDMTEISLSHMPIDQYDETIKLLKAFLGEFFDIPNEYTIGELQEKVELSPINDQVKEQVINLTDKINKTLYTKEEIKEKETEVIRNDFLEIIQILVPQKGTFTTVIPEEKFTINKIFHKKVVKTIEAANANEPSVHKEVQAIVPEEKPVFIKPDRELGKEIDKLKIAHSKKENPNQFLELEIKSIEAAYKIYLTNPNKEQKEKIKAKLEKLKTRI